MPSERPMGQRAEPPPRGGAEGTPWPGPSPLLVPSQPPPGAAQAPQNAPSLLSSPLAPLLARKYLLPDREELSSCPRLGRVSGGLSTRGQLMTPSRCLTRARICRHLAAGPGEGESEWAGLEAGSPSDPLGDVSVSWGSRHKRPHSECCPLAALEARSPGSRCWWNHIPCQGATGGSSRLLST